MITGIDGNAVTDGGDDDGGGRIVSADLINLQMRLDGIKDR